MAALNGFSDSQESSIIDPELFDELQNDPNFRPVLDQYHIITQKESDIKYSVTLCQNQSTDNLEQYPLNMSLPILQNQIPIKEEFAGPLQFELQLVTQPTGRHWVYSQMLQKVFIDMEETLPLRFKWAPIVDGLWVRTTMVFSLDQYRNESVQRCHNHMAPGNKYNVNIDEKKIKHVVRCTNPASIYEENGGHLSVITPLGVPQVGCEYVPMNFQFYCKNSCNSGMNRRPTELIFTLENAQSTVFGRRRLLVRVCSCPKRDKEKEEMEATGGKVLMSRSSNKKRKLEVVTGKKLSATTVDSTVYHVSLEIPGKENYLAILKYAYDVMAGQAIRHGQHDIYQSYMDEIMRKLQ